MKVSVGINIDSQYLRFAAVKAYGPRPKVFHCAAEAIHSFNDQQITQALSDIIKKNKIKCRSLSLCISRNLVTVRNLHLPSQDKQEVIQMIDLNVARIVPYKKDEIVFGYQMLGLDEMNYTKTLLSIVKNDVIRRQTKIIEGAGLFVDGVGLSSHGAWEWVLENYKSELNQSDLYLLLDIDSAFTDFIIFSRANLLFTRSINVGASGMKDQQGMVFTRLIGEVKQSLIMFYNEEVNRKPSVMFISGAQVKSDFGKMAEDELGLPAKAVPSPLEKDIPSDVSLCAVAELAARHDDRQIYFILPELKISRSLRERTKDIIITGTAFLYLLTVICGIFLGRIYNQQNYLQGLKQDYARVEKELGGLLGQLSRIEIVRRELNKRNFPLIVLAQLQKVTPEEIAVNSIAMDDIGKVTVRGQAVLLSDVFKFIRTLEGQRCFKEVQTKYTRKKKVKDKDLTDFELSFALAEYE